MGNQKHSNLDSCEGGQVKENQLQRVAPARGISSSPPKRNFSRRVISSILPELSAVFLLCIGDARMRTENSEHPSAVMYQWA